MDKNQMFREIFHICVKYYSTEASYAFAMQMLKVSINWFDENCFAEIKDISYMRLIAGEYPHTRCSYYFLTDDLYFAS